MAGVVASASREIQRSLAGVGADCPCSSIAQASAPCAETPPRTREEKRSPSCAPADFQVPGRRPSRLRLTFLMPCETLEERKPRTEGVSMAKAMNQLQDLIAPASQRARLARGEEVEVHLDTGDILDATITSLRSRSVGGGKITARSQAWSRWRGTADDLLTLINNAVAYIAKRSGEAPSINIRLSFGKTDEERFFDSQTFEEEIRSGESGSPRMRLRELKGIDITIGPTNTGSLKANAVFNSESPAPAASLAVEGSDRAVVADLKEELARLIDRGRPRVPALNGPGQMLVGGILGAGYFIGMSSVRWDFLSGWIGDVVFLLIFLCGYIALVYALVGGMKLLLPPLQLTAPGSPTPSQKWTPRIARLVGALGLAAVPFFLEKIFG